MKTWTKRELSVIVAKQTDTNPKLALEIISETFTTLREFLSEADPNVKIEIRGFGVLEVKPTRAKPAARNPKTGELVYVPPRRKTHFKPGKTLRKELSKPLEV